MQVEWKKNIIRIGMLALVAGTGAIANAGYPGDGSVSASDVLVPRDFIAYWSFDETGGSTAYDSAASGIHGEVHGATRVEGVVGNGLAFGGRSDYVEVLGDNGYPTQIGDLSEGTISVWFKFDTLPLTGAVYPVFYLGSRDGKSSLIIEIGHFSPNSALFFTIYENGFPPQCFDSNFQLTPHTWHHFAAVVGADFNTGYLDGKELVDRDYNFGTASSHYFFADVIDKEVCWIGRGLFGNLPQDQFFDGMIDEVQIFDRPLGAEEIARIYESVTGTSGECALDPNVWPDTDGDGVPDQCCVASAPLLPAGAMAMNRYLSFQSSVDDAHAIRITPTELPERFEHLVGQSFWVGPVRDVSELSGRTDSISRTFRAATLQCDPSYGNWKALGSVYVSHEMIIPDGIYEVQAVKAGCGQATELNFSEPLTLHTSAWGDVAGRFENATWTSPNRRVDVLVDVVAVLEKFSNAPGAPAKARTDLYPATPDRQITILDVMMAIEAFRGMPYPFSPPEPQCVR